MRIKQYKFDRTIQVVNFGDVHLGDKCCDKKAVRNVVSQIEKSDDIFWCSTGDLLNVALKNSKSDVYSSMSLKAELNELIELIDPIKEKCLGIVGSNHHKRLENEVGLNLDETISALSGIPYLSDLGVIDITCENCSYFIVLHHGCGGGRGIGAKANELARLAEVVAGADIYMQGHTHQFNYFPLETNYIDRKRKSVQTICSHFITTGHYLSWDDSYAQTLKLRPAPIGSAIATLYGNPVGQHKTKRVVVDFIN
jgi:hypothetical protein